MMKQASTVLLWSALLGTGLAGCRSTNSPTPALPSVSQAPYTPSAAAPPAYDYASQSAPPSPQANVNESSYSTADYSTPSKKASGCSSGNCSH